MLNLGNIKVVEQQGLTKMPQEAASAWAAFDGAMTGAGYKPVAFVGTQVVNGTNYFFVAEQTQITNPITRHIVLVKINESKGNYSKGEVKEII